VTEKLDPGQQKEWNLLYHRIRELLQPSEEGKDYVVMDCNYGAYGHRIEGESPKLVMPEVVKSLQELLIEHPYWEIVIVFSDSGGVVIRDDEVIDGLQRQDLAEELQTIKYEGSRPLGSRFGDIMYSDLTLSSNVGTPMNIHMPEDASIKKLLK
jgi:hypothetical protein